jgi:hypothetical protein
MKEFVFVLLFIVIGKLSGQAVCNDSAGSWHFETGNTFIEFLVIDTTLTDSITSVQRINEMLLKIGGNVTVAGNTLMAQVNNFNFSDKDCGFASLTTPYIMSSQVSFNISVSFKQGRYKVKCSNFITTMSLNGTVSSANWNNDIYKKNGCVRSSIGLDNFKKADCQLKKMLKLTPIINSDW